MPKIYIRTYIVHYEHEAIQIPKSENNIGAPYNIGVLTIDIILPCSTFDVMPALNLQIKYTNILINILILNIAYYAESLAR